MSSGSPRVLFVCPMPIGRLIAGLGIRTVELAGVLRKAGCDVTVAAPAMAGSPHLRDLRRVKLSNSSLARELRRHDCVIVEGPLVTRFPVLAASDTPLAVDLYDPQILTLAAINRDKPAGVLGVMMGEAADALATSVARADLVLCANERQRDLWRGVALACGRLTPSAIAADATLDDLIRVVPFGVASGMPQRGAAALRGVLPGVDEQSVIAIWAGGLHNWMDPAIVVEAMQLLVRDHDDLRMVFLGPAPPDIAGMPTSSGARAKQLSSRSGLLGRRIFFVGDWLPYEERGRYLAEADIGLSAHPSSIETRYSWRVRLLEYVWARLPVVSSSGDPLSDELVREGVAEVAAPGDVEGYADAMRRLLDDPARREQAHRQAERVAERLSWERAAEPLVEWVGNPRARDHGHLGLLRAERRLLEMYTRRALHTVSREGWSSLWERIHRYSDRAAR